MKTRSYLHVGRVVGLARVMPRERFVASHVRWFLVLEPRVVDDALGYDTAYTTDASADPEAANLTARDELNIIELVKSRSNPFADRISIGRASNCDVVLSDSSVSKLHAHVRDDNGQLLLVDVGSQNGTYINGSGLEPHVAAPLNLGDQLRFGSVATRVADAATVYDLVQAHSGDRMPVPR
jgi:FHA domain-containing protein